MRRDAITLLFLIPLLLIVLPAQADVSGTAARSVVWDNTGAAESDSLTSGQVREVVRRGMQGDAWELLALADPEPERSFNDEVGPVISVGLTDDERAYLRKRPQEAFFRSVVLPGWGQRYGERNVRGAVFSAVEVGLWAGMLLTRQTAIEGEKDYTTFARQHAGVTGSPDHQYYVDIGNYNNTAVFNEAQRQSRQYADQYKNPSAYWEWDSASNRERFKQLRIDADSAERQIYYFFGGMILNRIVSGIDASRGLARRQDDLRDKESALGYHMGFNTTTRGPELVISW